MLPIDLSDDQWTRLEELREELAEEYAGEYASVTSADVLTFLFDLVEAVDDPGQHLADPDPISDGDRSSDGSDDGRGGFPRDQLEAVLRDRNRKDEADDEMDLYTIAAEYEIIGRSEMTKEELIDAILSETRRRYTDPFAPVDVTFPPTEETEAGGSKRSEDEPDGAKSEASSSEQTPTEDASSGDDSGTDGSSADDSSTDAGDADQLDAMLHLLETHEDKWWQSDGDARYEVELPDGSRETARTKDDVRALLFRNY